MADSTPQPQPQPQPQSYADIRIRRAEEAGDVAEADYWRRIKAEVDKAPPLGPRQKALIRRLLLGTEA